MNTDGHTHMASTVYLWYFDSSLDYEYLLQLPHLHKKGGTRARKAIKQHKAQQLKIVV